jgi:hypothetical protein
MRVIIALVAAGLLLIPSALPAQPGVPPGGPPPVEQVASSGVFAVDAATPQHPGWGVRPSAAARAGVRWVRITADWSALEPARGQYDWAGLDATVREAVASGEHVLIVLQNTPRWAALTPDTPPSVWSHQPPRQPADWTAFVTAAASRYRDRVAAWQIEPSLDLSTFRGTALDYQEMLHAARRAVRRENPQALIVAASPPGLDLAYTKAMLSHAGADFDALMLYPKGRTPEDLLEALGVIRSRILTDARHQFWLSALPQWGAQPQMAIAALAGGMSREFWPALDPALTDAIRVMGGARFVGPINRGPGVFAFVFSNGSAPFVALWSSGATRSVPLATTGSPALVNASGGAVAPGSGGGATDVAVGADPVFVSNPAQSVVEEAAQTAAQGVFVPPRDADHDFSKAESVAATLGATNVERGLYNQRLRKLQAGCVVPVTVDGTEAVRTNQATDAVYVYFDVDHSFVYFADGRYDVVISAVVHRASAPRRVGFNIFYDSMSGYKFTPWQWVDAGSGWVTYTIRLPDASFSSAWGWDFALNGAGDKKEDLVVSAVTVTKARTGNP